MEKQFSQCNQLFVYNQDEYSEGTIERAIKIDTSDKEVSWFNVYGFKHKEIDQLIDFNGFDEFLKIILAEEEVKNKLIDLDESIYMSINVLLFEEDSFDYDRIRFIYTDNFVMTIQEKEGDYFDSVREFIRENKGIIRRRGADYLLYRLIESILDNYELAYKSVSASMDDRPDITNVKPDPKFVLEIEQFKQKLLTIKSTLLSLKEVLLQLENWDTESLRFSYFSSLKESTNYLIEDIDMNLQMEESKLNLIFNIQSHRLNEVMKTLTIFSVIFIPLTFMAGIYGMNFDNIPELHHPNGYFILIGAMLVVVTFTIIYFRRKKWF